VGRATGAGQPWLVTAAARATVAFGVVAGLGLATLLLIGKDALVGLFPAAGTSVREAASTYLSVVLYALPLHLLAFLAAACLQASGDTRTPFAVAALGNALNMALNYVLIFGRFGAPELGITGAAAATASAMTFQGVVLLWLLASGRRAVALAGRGGERHALARMGRVAAASMSERVVMQLGFFGFALIIGTLGGTAMAANQALLAIEAVCFLSADGFGIAAAALVAQHLGAGRPHAAALVARTTTRLAVSLLAIFAIGFVLLPGALLRAFSDDPVIVAAALPCLFVAAASQPFLATAVVSSEALRGAGATKTALGITLLAGFVVRLGATSLFVFGLELGLVGVWLGSTTDWVVRALSFRAAVRHGAWQTQVV
jgi:putative MATE family efflux protein